MKKLLSIAALLLAGTAAGQVNWSAPVSIISDAEETRHDTTPKVAIGADGKVGVAWISQYKEGTSITERLRSNIYVSYSSTRHWRS